MTKRSVLTTVKIDDPAVRLGAIYQRARFDGATDLEQTALYIGNWALMGFGYWVIEEKATGEFVGDVGFADFKRDITASMRGKPELGFALASRFHVKGYATEAVRAALAWADAELPQPAAVCLVAPQNTASLRACKVQTFFIGVT